MSLALSLAYNPAGAQTDAEWLPDVTGQDDGSLQTTAPLAPRPVPEAIKEAEKEAERATEQATNGGGEATVAPVSEGDSAAQPAPKAAAATDPSETPKLPAELATELETLITTLEDETARTKLISQLRLLLETQAEPAAADEEAPRTQSFGGKIASAILSRAVLIGDRSAQALTYLRQLPNVGQWFQRQVADPKKREAWIEIIGQLAAIFAAGLVADLVFRFGLNRLRLRLAPREGDFPLERALILFGRGLVKLVPVATFTVGAYFTMIALDPDVTVQWVTVGLLWAALAARTIAVASRVIFRPDRPELRVLRMDDQSCRDAHSRIVWLSGLTIYGYAGTEVLRFLGVPTALQALLKLGLGLAVAILSIRLVLLTGRRLTEWIRGKPAELPAGAEEPELRPVGRVGRLRQMFADFWQVAIVAYILIVYVIWAFDVQDGFAYLIRGTIGTLLVVAGAVIIHALARRLAEFSIKFNDTWRARYPTFEKRLDFYIRMVHRAAVLLVDIAAVFLILEVWGVDSLSWLTSPLGREVLSDAVSIGIVIIIAIIIWEVLGFLIEGHLNRRGADGRPLMASTRVRTLLPVIRNAILIALSILVALTALSEFGVNIGPLLAGVGVLGIAVGFGAQELVKDVINGMFILFDNSVSVGDVVDIGGHAGVVEAMNIRTIRLRDLSGTVHVVPLSQVSSIINMTRDFSYALVDAGVGYREDVDEVIEVLRDLARDMRDDPDWRYKILEDLEVLGLDQLADSAVVIRVRFKTVAGEQWGVRREFNRRMKKRFDELSIEIPFPHQTLYFGEDKEGRAPVAKVSLESPSPAERIARDAELGPAALRRRHAQKTDNPRVVGEADVADVADAE